MKRKVSIFLLLILLMSATGFTLEKHYCNGKLVNTSLFPRLGDHCDSSMPMTKDSCENEFLIILLDSPFELIVAKIVFEDLAFWADLPKTFLLTGANDGYLKIRKIAFSSPPISNIKIYKQIESYLN